MTRQVKFLDVGATYRELRKPLTDAFARVMNSGRYVLGPEVEAFEREFAAYCGTKYCISVGTGLDAIRIALQTIPSFPGARAAVPTNTFIATWLAVNQAGGIPVPVEPNRRSMNMEAAEIPLVAKKTVAAIIPVHLYGNPARMDAYQQLDQLGIPVIEDAAQAHGATFKSRRVGSFGWAGAFSFYPGKNLGAYGDGGAITTNLAQVAERARLIRNYGSTKKYVHEIQGTNSRLDELQAAFLRVRLRKIDVWNERRRRIAELYMSRLRDRPTILLPHAHAAAVPVWHLFVIRQRRRERMKQWLAKRGVETSTHYPTPPHLSLAYRRDGASIREFPIAEEMANTVLSLPIGPHMTIAQAKYVAEQVVEFDDRTNLA